MRVPKLAWARSVLTSIACFITRMRERALEADIVVVNHHLFFADLLCATACTAACCLITRP